MAKGSKIGVVTVTYNSATVLEGFMKSMLAQSHENFVLYVIDNASRDQSLAMLGAYSDSRIQIVANQKNVGVAEGNNQGIALALQQQCDYVLLLNNDTEFAGDLFSILLQGMALHDAEMLVPKIMYYEPRNMIWCAGGYMKPWMGYVNDHFGDGQIDHGQFDSARPVAYAPTCCMLVRASVFATVGTMDSRYFVYCDDLDFCWRAVQSGVRLWYDPAGVLYHKVSSLTGGAQSDFATQYSTRNKVYFVLKNLGFLKVAYCLTIYQMIFLVKLLIGRDSLRVYRMKLTWYFRGIGMYRAAGKS
jgi:GT2 family glycosyltransferase